MIFGFSKTMYIFIYMYKNFSLLQKKRETLASIDTLVSESFGQFVLRNELCGLAKNLPLLYWWNTRTSLSVWKGYQYHFCLGEYATPPARLLNFNKLRIFMEKLEFRWNSGSNVLASMMVIGWSHICKKWKKKLFSWKKEKMKFELNEMFQWNTSKYSLYYAVFFVLPFCASFTFLSYVN